MLADILRFLIDILFTLFGAALLLRLWVQAVRLSPYNPITNVLQQATNWLVHPLRRVIPGFRGIDWACVVGAWLTAWVYVMLLALVAGLDITRVLAISVPYALLEVVKWGLHLVVWTTLFQAILSWVNPRTPVMGLLQTLTYPLLEPIRRRLPRLGGLDFSPLVLIVLAQIGVIITTRLTFDLLF